MANRDAIRHGATQGTNARGHPESELRVRRRSASNPWQMVAEHLAENLQPVVLEAGECKAEPKTGGGPGIHRVNLSGMNFNDPSPLPGVKRWRSQQEHQGRMRKDVRAGQHARSGDRQVMGPAMERLLVLMPFEDQGDLPLDVISLRTPMVDIGHDGRHAGPRSKPPPADAVRATGVFRYAVAWVHGTSVSTQAAWRCEIGHIFPGNFVRLHGLPATIRSGQPPSVPTCSGCGGN